MNRIIMLAVSLLLIVSVGSSQDKQETKSSNIHQWYSGKFGFYSPSDGLNNGLMVGIDGITEFLHYNFFLSGAIEIYPKQTIDIFSDPKPSISQQQVIILPLHVNVGYKLFDVENADSRGYIGVGGGYYFYFYNVDYQTNSGGVLGGLTSRSQTSNGGGVFGTLFARALISRIFVEPRFYIASKKNETIEGRHTYHINPSGFSVTLGFQY